jgi:hypothetical protein
MALEEIKETTDDLPDKMSLDNGYMDQRGHLNRKLRF